MEFVSKGIIRIDRELSALDKFTLDFINILRKHTKYVIVSGYVSILLGRARVSEDIDIIIPKTGFSKFKQLLKELNQKGFYCLNAVKDKNIYDYLEKNFAIRFARKNTAIPNIELKFAKKNIDNVALNNAIKVKINKDELAVSQLELQIAYKEKVLKSQKDIEDASHIRIVAKKYLNNELIKKYERLLNEK